MIAGPSFYVWTSSAIGASLTPSKHRVSCPNCRALVGTGRNSPDDRKETKMINQTMSSEVRSECSPATGSLKPKSKKLTGKTKVEILRKLMSRPNGVTVAQIQKHLVWQPHTIWAAISRLRSSGLPIALDRSGRAARYRVASGE